MNNFAKYSIKGMQSFKTDDGIAFSGSLCFDGNKVASFCNHGNGGSTDIHYVSKDAELNFINTAKEEGFDAKYVGIDEMAIDRLADASDGLKVLKRNLKKYVCFVLPNHGPGAYGNLSTNEVTSKVINYLDSKYPKYDILNNKSDEDLWSLVLSWYKAS